MNKDTKNIYFIADTLALELIVCSRNEFKHEATSKLLGLDDSQLALGEKDE